MFVKETSNTLATALSTHFREPITIHSSSPLLGGCINEAARLNTSAGTFFVKWNDALQFPGMFNAEAKGLNLLRQSKGLYIPEVITLNTVDHTAFLFLEFVEPGMRSSDFWEQFGRQLTHLHQNTTVEFGLDHNNYIGSLPQYNTQYDNWPEFFINMRIMPQLQQLNPHAYTLVSAAFETLFSKLEDLFPKEAPALLHGDLWSGNFMTSPDGGPCIFDPAVYYGHREMDLAMTKLFGGFAPEFYSAYKEAFPLEKGWEERLDICNLYPLLVHVNLFGGSYLNQVKEILKHFV